MVLLDFVSLDAAQGDHRLLLILWHSVPAQSLTETAVIEDELELENNNKRLVGPSFYREVIWGQVNNE